MMRGHRLEVKALKERKAADRAALCRKQRTMNRCVLLRSKANQTLIEEMGKEPAIQYLPAITYPPLRSNSLPVRAQKHGLRATLRASTRKQKPKLSGLPLLERINMVGPGRVWRHARPLTPPKEVVLVRRKKSVPLLDEDGEVLEDWVPEEQGEEEPLAEALKTTQSVV